jgi:photosystem II stability/assembly factor-like uncharacterized protein
VLRTKDGGKSWEQYPLDWMSIFSGNLSKFVALYANLYDIFFVDALHGWIVGEKGAVLYTCDGGEQWEVLRIGDYPSLYSVHFKNKVEGFAVGQDGSFVHTEDGGESWEQINLPQEISRLSLFRIAMKGPLGIVVGDRSVVIRSTDGGKSWERTILELRPPLPWLLDVVIPPGNPSKEAILIGKGIITQISLTQSE